MTSPTLLVGNWKMNLGIEGSVSLAAGIAKAAEKTQQTDVWIAPSAMALAAVSETIKSTKVSLGAQNVWSEDKGAFTGELSVAMLKEVGCSFALTGHSERRHICGESKTLCAQRAVGALRQKFPVIFCIGETLDERQRKETERVLTAQLLALREVGLSESPELILAYEPVWAIGTGHVAEPEQINEVHEFIVRLWLERFWSDVPRILYGGSVTPDNFKEILTVPHVAGGLVGGASLSQEKFAALIRISEEGIAREASHS